MQDTGCNTDDVPVSYLDGPGQSRRFPPNKTTRTTRPVNDPRRPWKVSGSAHAITPVLATRIRPKKRGAQDTYRTCSFSPCPGRVLPAVLLQILALGTPLPFFFQAWRWQRTVPRL